MVAISIRVPPALVYIPDFVPDEIMETVMKADETITLDDCDWVVHFHKLFIEWHEKNVGGMFPPAFIDQMDPCRPKRVNMPDGSAVYFCYHA
jgi:hypothetical protein